MPLEILHPQDALHYAGHTQQADRVNYSWPCLTQEEISTVPVDVLRRAISSVYDRLAECEQRNGEHLEDVIFFMFCVVFQDHQFTYFYKC